MSLDTRDYADLIDDISALTGVTMGDSSKDLSRANSLLNLAARRAYGLSQWWERYLVVDEPRTVSEGVISFTEDSFHVYGAGTDEVNGLYQRNGTANGKARYSLYDADGSTILWDIEWDNSTDWQILVGAGNTLTENTVYYDITDASTTPPLAGWAKNAAAAENPAPTLVDVAEIKTTLHVTRYPFLSGGARTPIGYWVDGQGIKLKSSDDIKIAYVTYKKPLSDTFGDGTAGTTSTIPAEFAQYMVYFAAHHMMAAKNTSSSNPSFGISQREMRESLEDELMRLEDQGVTEGIAKHIYTHLSRANIL